MHPTEVACVGLATADTIVDLPAWPSPDGRMLADGIVRAFGGPAATAAVTIARLGHRSSLVGAVGDDELGEAIRADLADAGVDVSHLETRHGRSAESVILLDSSSATRTILHAPGVALDRLRGSLATAPWVHADHVGYPLVGSVEPGRLCVDAGHRVEGLQLDGLALYAPSAAALLDRFPGRSLGDGVAAALEEGAGRVAVTLGGDGAVAADATGAWRVGGVAVDVVSTLGAGDVFHGALLASLLDGDSLPEAMRRANLAAALSCRALDGRGAIPSASELDAALAGAPAVESVLLEDLA